jgi:hypothetical protein
MALLLVLLVFAAGALVPGSVADFPANLDALPSNTAVLDLSSMGISAIPQGVFDRFYNLTAL